MDRAVNSERLGANADAVTLLSQAIAANALSRPDAVRAYYDRGVAYDALGKTRAAIDDYSAALRLDSRFAPALNNRANAYRRMGRSVEARRDYLMALKCPAVSREYTYFGLGQIAETAGDQVAARDYYHEALAANPGFAIAAQSLVRLDYLQRNPVMNASVQVPHKAPAQPVTLRHAIVETKNGGSKIQLGAFRDEASAKAGWQSIAANSEGVLNGLSPLIEIADIPGKGRYYRLRTSLPNRQEARRTCEKLSAQGHACLLAND